MSDAPTSLDAPVTKRSKWFWFRVAISTFFGLLTLALCVLWLRSYQVNELISQVTSGFVPPTADYTDLKVTAVGLSNGRLYAVRNPVRDHDIKVHGWRYLETPLQRTEMVYTDRQQNAGRKNSWSHLVWGPLPYAQHLPKGFSFKATGVCVPIWSLAVGCVTAVALIWLPVIMRSIPSPQHRFSLRAMLIATTLVAVVLGLLVWAGR